MNYNDFMEAYYGFPVQPINNMNIALDSPDEGFLKGNMFKDTYESYKNYQYRTINPTNEKEKLLYEIAKYSFATHDLNLYLDLHNDDNSLLMLFNDYRKKTNDLINEYENKFGPMTISTDDEKSIPFKWASKDFPWGGISNV